MSTYISLDNLARYDLKAKARAESLYADASAACWQKTEKAGAVTCVPAPETPLEPVVEFLFKETLPEGTKGPENPSTITGVSEIKVTRANSNLIRWPYFDSSGRENNGITWTVNGDGSISATGTSSAGSSFRMQPTDNYLTYGVKLAAGTYRLSGCPAGGAWNSTWAVRSAVYSADAGKVTLGQDLGNGATVTVTEPSYLAFFCYIWSGNTVSNLTFAPKFQLVEAPFEKNEQDVCTIPLGSTFYGGTLDVASGVMTVTQFFYSFTGEETITVTDKGDGWKCFYYRRTDVLADNSSAQTNETRKVCTHFPFVYNANQQSTHWYVQGGGNICLFSNQFADADAFKAWLAAQKQNGTPVELTFNLANPYTIQLDPVMINALPAIGRTSPRVNTVYTDAESVQVGYAEHPAYTEELINNAILALGGDI